MSTAEIASRIDALLPQTQCTRCGFPACRPYADAVASGAADINQCPPGGQSGVDALATLLGISSKPLSPFFGLELPPAVALIDENVCIGCTKCIQACPVDAIIGAGKRMHTVIAAECTGCELCVPPCPVDCIVMVKTAAQPLARLAVLDRATKAKLRFDNRAQRLARMDGERSARHEAAKPVEAPKGAPISRDAVLDAIARGKARRASLKTAAKITDTR